MSWLLLMLACSGGKDSGSETTENTNSTGTSMTDDTASTQGVATLLGSVSSTVPGTTGKFYVAVFNEDPLAGSNTPEIAKTASTDVVDLSSPDKTSSYRIEGIPVKADPYYVVAFVDINNNYDATQTPDSGDILALDGAGAYSVTLATADEEVTLDLVFSMARP